MNGEMICGQHPRRYRRRLARRRGLLFLLCLFWAGWCAAAEPASPVATQRPGQVLTLDAAVRYALTNNPELTALRQQNGIAAAGVVIARTYPFNPTLESKIRAATGPASAGITNNVSNEHNVLIDVELHHQGRYRRQGAYAALSRTEMEVAAQELNFAIRTVRAFDALLYRHEKLRLAGETVRLNEQAAEQVRTLVENGRLRGADLILSRTEADDARAQQAPARKEYVAARYELRRLLGVINEEIDIEGTLGLPAMPESDVANLMQTALDQRPDLHARQQAVAEAEAKYRLEVANRYGNPNIGPAYEYDPARVNLIGFQIVLPLPVFNTHRGDIMQRDAERIKAALDLHQAEVQVRQDVQTALARLAETRNWVSTYRTQLLPNMQKSLEGIEQLFTKGDPGVDVLRVIDVRRKLLKTRDGYLDAQWEASQAQADLAAAVGDPALAVPAGK